MNTLAGIVGAKMCGLFPTFAKATLAFKILILLIFQTEIKLGLTLDLPKSPLNTPPVSEKDNEKPMMNHCIETIETLSAVDIKRVSIFFLFIIPP